MSGLKLHKKSTGYHLTRNGKKVGTPIPKMTMAFEWTYITLDIDAQTDLRVVGDFLLLISDSTHIVMQSTKSIHLCFFEGELTHGDDERFGISVHCCFTQTVMGTTRLLASCKPPPVVFKRLKGQFIFR